jgi:hypothetical protein
MGHGKQTAGKQGASAISGSVRRTTSPIPVNERARSTASFDSAARFEIIPANRREMKRRRLLVALPLLASGMVNPRAGEAASSLRVGAALPDPPFEFMTSAGPVGFDVALMRRIAAQLGREWQLVRYTGADFNDIFGILDDGTYDCVASGATITPDRERIADFCAPYAISGQALVVDPSRH